MFDVDAPIQSFLAEFFAAWPFHHLSNPVKNQIAKKLRICSFRPGELIYSPRELPSFVHCVVQGRVRILGPTSYQSPTLAIGERGTVIGWDSLLRRVSVGSVRAAIAPGAQEILTLALAADEFEILALQQLMPVLGDRASSSEVFDILSHFLSRMPARFSELDLKDLVQYIEREQLVTVESYFSGKDGAASLSLSADRIWLLSSSNHSSLPIGTPVGSVHQLHTSQSSRFPFRLLGFDRSFISSAVLSGVVPKLPASLELAQPAFPGITSVAIPVDIASDSLSDSLPASPGSTPQHYPIWRASLADPVEDIVACFGMICERMQVPYRADSLRRWLNQRSATIVNQWEPFDVCLRIAEAIGFNAHIVRFTPTAGGINRLNTPAIIQCRNVLAVLHEVTPKTVIVGSPRTGLLHLQPEELAQRLTIEELPGTGAISQAIILERLPHTPTKRFGFSWFIPALMSQRGVLIQVLIASLFIQLLGVANPLLVQQVVDSVVVAANPGAMPMFGILMLLCAFFEGGLTVLRMYLFAGTANRVDLHLGIEIVRHLLRLPLNFFEKRPVGELSVRLSELENIRQFLTGTALTVVLDVVFSIFYIGVMFLYSAKLALCVLLTVPIVIASTLLVSTIQQKLIRTQADHHSKVQSYLVEILGGIFTVKAQHIEPLVEATWRDRYVQYLSVGFQTSTVSTLFGSFSSFLSTVSSLLVLWVGADLVLQGELTLGGLIAFRILAGYVTTPLLRLAGLWQNFQETSLSMELLADIADSPTEELSHEVQLQIPAIQGRVQYDQVSFSFQPGSLQLDQVSLDIPAGAFVGIVGQSGSGKSTLMKLLPRLYSVQSGKIYLDGYDVSKVNLSSLRQQIGIVPQDAVLFEGSIRDNIALFSALSDEEVIEAARVADAHDFIMQLPDGYRTQVGERGGSLSGGQRQRIAIARVVARNPRLLIFDEATSALDYETEKRVCENLMRRFGDRTCFFITHRLNTITRSDHILFMQAGKIVEQGTHQELMANRQLYYCLYTQQAQF